MKILSIRQPWAYLIVTGVKGIENRDWNTFYRGPLLIHASKTIDYAAFESIARVHDLQIPALLPTGGIVGRVELVDVMTKSDSPWFQGKYGFVLSHATLLPFVPARGQMGLFEWSEDVVGARR